MRKRQVSAYIAKPVGSDAKVLVSVPSAAVKIVVMGRPSATWRERRLSPFIQSQLNAPGKAASHAFAHLNVRCERPLRVVAATVASIGREHSFEPRGFAKAVAEATGLPTFDVYAGARVA